jgi:biopolymer transport protein TolR
MNKRFAKRKLVAEINIVPYVDVMLVLLVIFMAVAPILTQGVQVELPSASSEPLPHDQKPPIVVSVNKEGQLFLDQAKEAIDPTTLSVRVQALLKIDPSRAVLVRGDKSVDYGKVVAAMALLNKAGVTKVGLMTQHIEDFQMKPAARTRQGGR